MVSHDLEAAEAKRYELTGTSMFGATGLGDPVDISNFAILKPGKYTRWIIVSAPIPYPIVCLRQKATLRRALITCRLK